MSPVSQRPRPQTHLSRGQVRRAKVVQATVELIAERGIEGVSHRSVAARADVPAATPGYYFASIDDLIGAAIIRIAEEILSSVEAMVATMTAHEGDRREFADDLIAMVASARPMTVRVQFEAYLAANRRPELREPVAELMRGFDAATATVLAAIGVPDPEEVAVQLMAVVDGFALHRVVRPQGADVDQARLSTVLRRVLDSHLDRRPDSYLDRRLDGPALAQPSARF